MAKRNLSSQAQVAKICKQYCKSLGINARVKSASFSMGDSVDVHVENVDPETLKKIELEFSQYEYGHFDGMIDMYEMSNCRDDIPQTKFLFVHNKFSADYHQTAWDLMRETYPGNYKDFPADYNDAEEMQTGEGYDGFRTVRNEVLRLLSGSGHCDLDRGISAKFWNGIKKPEKKMLKVPVTVSAQENTISKHRHTKRDFDMWIVQLDDRVDRDEFITLRDAAKSIGGWYSRKWGSTPGGFAFTNEDTAVKFAGQISA